MYYVYCLISENYLNRLYIGISDNPIRRLSEHNAGETKSTKAYRPYRLLFQEQRADRIAARQREKFLKSGCGREWIKIKYLGQ